MQDVMLISGQGIVVLGVLRAIGAEMKGTSSSTPAPASWKELWFERHQ